MKEIVAANINSWIIFCNMFVKKNLYDEMKFFYFRSELGKERLKTAKYNYRQYEYWLIRYFYDMYVIPNRNSPHLIFDELLCDIETREVVYDNQP